jgi:hypothetical protein
MNVNKYPTTTIVDNLQKYFSLIALFLCISLSANAQKHSTRILFIPLDDRPPCLQFPTQMGLIADAELVAPPRTMLGRFTDFGKCDSIIQWLKQQDLSKIDAVIVSMDMLAYGGLVASRVHQTPLDVAQNRVGVVQELRKKKPSLKIYGSSVIMRLAPTADTKNEAYREKLSRWADLSPYSENKEIVDKLESEIPKDALENYKSARHRNLTINELAIKLTQNGTFDYLILSQDDAKPKGIHIADRERLTELVNSQNLTEKIAIQPGADEVSMLLLARAMTQKSHYQPKIKPIFSSEKMAATAMPYEDRPLSKTVSFHIKAAGGVEVTTEAEADILFYVFTSRFEPQRALSFAEEIKKSSQKPIILADVDPKGDVQGGDTTFTEGVLRKGLFAKFYGYACWNTAGNTIGTALPHGIVYGTAQAILKGKIKKKVKKRMEIAQKWFTLNRLLDDYAYHSIVRPKALQYIKDQKWNPFRLMDAQTQTMTTFCLERLTPLAAHLSKNYGINTHGAIIQNLRFTLPWNRTFEAEIDFNYSK